MTRRRRQGINARLSFARGALAQVHTNPAVAEPLAQYGYGPAALAEGQALYDRALSLHTRRANVSGELRVATALVRQRLQQAQGTYRVLLALARVALHGDERAAVAMELGGARARANVAWAEQATRFYANALAMPDALEKLARLNISAAQLAAGLGEVQALSQAIHAQCLARGVARAATRERDAALAELHTWVGNLITVARIATRHSPQLMESFGIVVPS